MRVIGSEHRAGLSDGNDFLDDCVGCGCLALVHAERFAASNVLVIEFRDAPEWRYARGRAPRRSAHADGDRLLLSDVDGESNGAGIDLAARAIDVQRCVTVRYVRSGI